MDHDGAQRRICDREYFPHRTRFDDARIIGIRSMQISVNDSVGFDGLMVEDADASTPSDPLGARITDPLLLAETEDALGCLHRDERARDGKPAFFLRRLARVHRGLAEELPSRVYLLDDLAKDPRAITDLQCILQPHLPNTCTERRLEPSSSSSHSARGLDLGWMPLQLVGSAVCVESWLSSQLEKTGALSLADIIARSDTNAWQTRHMLRKGESSPWLDSVVRIVSTSDKSGDVTDVALQLDVPVWTSDKFGSGLFDPQQLFDQVCAAHGSRNEAPRWSFVFQCGSCTDEKPNLTQTERALVMRGHLVEQHYRFESEHSMCHAAWLFSMGGLCGSLCFTAPTSHAVYRGMECALDDDDQACHIYTPIEFSITIRIGSS